MWKSEAKRVRYISFAFLQPRWEAFYNWRSLKEVSPACLHRLCKSMFKIVSVFFTLVAKLLTTVCATGGGAFKFEDEFHKVSNRKTDFLMSCMHNFRAFFARFSGSEHAASEI